MVFRLQCNLFSLAKVGVYNTATDEEIENDKLTASLKKPNYFQYGRQWLYDYMFWNMTGCAYMYAYSRVASTDNVIYWLNNDCLTIPPDLERRLDKLIVSKAEYKRLLKEQVLYKYNDGSTEKIRLEKLLPLADISNGFGNWFSGPSAIDALYKIISNSEQALDAKNTNLLFSGKFMVGGDQGAQDDIYKMPLGKNEQASIEKKLLENKQITAVSQLVDIKRFVENLDQLSLDESHLSDYYKIGKMYSIPRDVLEAYAQDGATYENQEKATGKHVGYTLQPKADDLAQALTSYFMYEDQGKEVRITFEHLPFVQVFEKEKAEVKFTKSKTVEKLTKAGVPLEDALKEAELDIEVVTENVNNEGNEPEEDAEV